MLNIYKQSFSTISLTNLSNVYLFSQPSIGEIAKYIAKEFNYENMIEFDNSYSDGQFKKTADNSKLINLYGDYEFTRIDHGIKKVLIGLYLIIINVEIIYTINNMNNLNLIKFKNKKYYYNSKVIKKEEIFKYLLNIEDKNSNIHYNIGNILNIPYYFNNNPWELSRQFRGVNTKEFKNTLVNYYFKNFKLGKDTVPDTIRLNSSIDKYIEDNKLKYYSSIFNQDNILVVHLRVGDMGEISNKYYKTILNLSKNFYKIFLLVGIHRNTAYKNKKHIVIKNTNNSIFKIFDNINNACIVIGNADEHISIMKFSKNLLLHKGSYTVIGSIVCPNNVYITDEFSAHKSDRWKKMINSLKTKIIKI